MATIQPTLTKVKFLHFTGTLTLWESFIKNDSLDDGYIVYGYIYDVEDKSTRKLVSKQIYAGKDSNKLQYIYEVGGGSSSSIVVDTYEEAEEQLSSLSEGDIISTRNDQTVYIVLKSPETEELELVKICKRCKWLYAADTSISGDNWHVASDVITNPMGMIAENTTLGEFVELTEGEFSRMIEMMLFKNPKPEIGELILSNAATDVDVQQKELKLVLKVTKGSDPSASIKLNDAGSSPESITLDGPTTEGDYDVYTALVNSYNGKNLVSNTEYKVIATTEKGGETSDTLNATATTAKYSNAEISNISYEKETDPSSEDNTYTIKLDGGEVTSGDYSYSPITTYYLDNTSYSSLDEIKKVALTYGKTYKVKVTYSGNSSTYNGAYESTEVSKTKDVSATPKNTLTINTINGEAYSSTTTYTLTSSEVAINLAATSEVKDASIYVTYIGDTSVYSKNTKDIIVTAKTGDAEQTITILVKDSCGGTAVSKSIKILYTVEELLAVGLFNKDATSIKTYNVYSRGGYTEKKVTVTETFGDSVNAATLIKNSADSEYCGASGNENNKGIYYAYFIDNAYNNDGTTEGLININDLEEIVFNNVKYKKYIALKSSTLEITGFVFAIVPTNYVVEWYDDSNGNPNVKQNCITLNITYNDQELIAYCQVPSGTNWDEKIISSGSDKQMYLRIIKN